MAVIFISHSSEDDELASRLVEALRESGLESVFLDHDDDDGIGPSENWRASLNSALLQAEVLVYLGTAAAARSAWCSAEIATAFAMGIPVRAFQAEPGAGQPLLADIQWLRWSDDVDGALDRLVDNVADVIKAKARRYSWDATRSPFPGLRSFSVDDAGVFFGRDDLVDRIVTLVSPTNYVDDDSLLVIQGSSGVGKSSLLAAGVIPELLDLRREGGPAWSAVGPIRPGADPFAELAIAVEELFGRSGSVEAIGVPAAALPGHLRADPANLRTLLRSGAGRDDPAGEAVVLLVDQAEELVGSSAEERLRFLEVLATTAARGSRCAVILTARSAFVDAIFDGAGLDTRLRPVMVTALTRAELPVLIEGPAKRAGLTFAPGLVGMLVDETASGRALPLLAYCLRELYRLAAETGETTITLDHHDQVGGVEGAISAQFEDMTHDWSADDLIALFLRLVEVDDDGLRRRRTVPRRSFSTLEQELLGRLQARRLIAIDDERVSVTHESIFGAWPSLDAAVRDRSKDLALRRRLDRAALMWEAGRTDSDLLRGHRLDEALDWREREVDLDVAPSTEAFIQASVDRERRRRLTMLGAGTAAALVVAIAGLLGVLQLRANARADLSDQVARARQLVQLSEATERIDRSAGFALEALQASDDPETLAAVGRSVFRQPQLLGYLPGHSEDVRAVAFLPDGSLVSGDAVGRVLLWSASGVLESDLGSPGDGALVRSLSVAPSGDWIARSDGAGRVSVLDRRTEVWSVLTGPGSERDVHGGAVTQVRSVDDDRLVSIGLEGGDDTDAGPEGRMVLWSAAGGPPLWSVESDVGLWGLAVDRERELVAAVGDNGRIEVRSLIDGAVVATVSKGSKRLHVVGFDPASGALLVGGEDRALTRMVLNEEGIGSPETLWLSDGTVWTIDAAANGLIYFAGSDGGARVRFADGEIRELGGHDRNVTRLALSGDGSRLAIGSFDGTISIHGLGSNGLIDIMVEAAEDYIGAVDDLGTLWVSGTGRRLARLDPASGLLEAVIPELPEAVGDLAVNGPGTLLALGMTDGSAMIVDLAGARLQTSVVEVGRIPDAPSVAVAVGPHDRVVASGDDRTVIVDPDGTLLELEPVVVNGEGLAMQAVAWSSDGALVIGGGEGNVVVTWSAATGRLVDRSTHASNEIGRVTRLVVADDRVYSLGSDQRVLGWSVSPLEADDSFGQHRNVPNDVSVVAVGISASVDNDGVLHVWDSTTGVSLIGAVQLPVRLGWRVASGGQDSIIVFGRGGIVRVRLDSVGLLRQACALSTTASDIGTGAICTAPDKVTARLTSP